jgi:hypothetical protein
MIAVKKQAWVWVCDESRAAALVAAALGSLIVEFEIPPMCVADIQASLTVNGAGGVSVLATDRWTLTNRADYKKAELSNVTQHAVLPEDPLGGAALNMTWRLSGPGRYIALLSNGSLQTGLVQLTAGLVLSPLVSMSEEQFDNIAKLGAVVIVGAQQ